MIRRTAAAIALILASSGANASFIAVDNVLPADSTIGVVGSNNFGGSLAGQGVLNYTLGASLGMAADGDGDVDFYYYGKEAGYRNVFSAAGGSVTYNTGYSPTLQNNFSTPIFIGSMSVTGGATLDFRFCAYSGGNSLVGCLSNTQNDARGINSFQSIALNITDSVAWILWDDSGAGPDDNHDDMLIRAVFRPRAVSEPTTLALAGLGLLGLGIARRLRK
jgi:hypothetical protein